MEQTGLILARALVYLTLLPAAGLPLYFATAESRSAVPRAARRAAALLALLAALATAWWVAASVAAMAALPLGELDRETLQAVADATPLAMVAKVRLAALAALVLALLLPAPRLLPALAGLAALGTAAFTGHAGATEGAAGTFHRLADLAHLAAAACWVGALAVFACGALGGRDKALAERLARFAGTGTGVVLVLLATGIANAVLIAGWPLAWRSAWTGLLAVKIALFAGMLGLAGLNRWKLTPALAGEGAAPRRTIGASLTLESALALAVLILVAALGTLDPAGG